VRTLIFLVALVGAGLAAALAMASEMGGEVVEITTRDDRDVEYKTSLWIVEDQGSEWLRAGSRESAWYKRLVANPEIRMQRNGQTFPYRATPVREATPRINALMARDYGWADQVVGLMRDESKSVAVRLERISEKPF
jgi:hypothetical protein